MKCVYFIDLPASAKHPEEMIRSCPNRRVRREAYLLNKSDPCIRLRATHYELPSRGDCQSSY